MQWKWTEKNYIKNERCTVAPFQVSKISEFEPWRSRRTQCRFGLRQCLRWPSAELGIFPRPCLDMTIYVSFTGVIVIQPKSSKGSARLESLQKKDVSPDFRKTQECKNEGENPPGTWTSMHQAAFPRLPIALLSALHRVGTSVDVSAPMAQTL